MDTLNSDSDKLDFPLTGETAPENLKEKMDQLYSETQAIKMTNLGAFLKASTSESAAPGELLKLSQVAMKAIELQLKILADQEAVSLY